MYSYTIGLHSLGSLNFFYTSGVNTKAEKFLYHHESGGNETNHSSRSVIGIGPREHSIII